MTLRQVIASLATFLVGSSLFSSPALAGAKAFTVTLTPIPAYAGPCPVTLKFTGVISGKAGSKPTYQFARTVGGTPSSTPWTAGTIPVPPPPATLTVSDSMIVPVALAGIETETLRVQQGPVSASVKVSVTCVNPTPTPTPTPKKPATLMTIGPAINPNATPTPTQTPRFSPAVTNMRLVTPTPSPPPHYLIALPAHFILSSTQWDKRNVGFGCQGSDKHMDFDTTQMIMGYLYTADSDNLGICWWHNSKWSRAAVVFNLSNVIGKKIWKATIQFQTDQYTSYILPKVSNSLVPNEAEREQMHEGAYHQYSSYRICTTTIGVGRAPWWMYHQWLDYTPIGGRYEGSTNDPWDVTAVIAGWAKAGSLNYGFVFAGGQEGQKTLDYQWGCQSKFKNPTLLVEYS
jgi:hypothetical protein